MNETNSNGQDAKAEGEQAEAKKQDETNGEKVETTGTAKPPLEPSIAIANDGSFFQITIPTRIGHFGASGFIHEAVLPWLRSFHKELKQKQQKIISPQQGFRGYNPFKRRI